MLPRLAGRPIRVQIRPSLGVHLAETSIPRRLIFLDRQVLQRRGEFERILIHELFHFVWVRLSNQARWDWERVVAAEFARRSPGELGWSAEWRKEKLSRRDLRQRTGRWRRYVCESFCDSAAWMYAGLTRHDEYTLAAPEKQVSSVSITEDSTIKAAADRQPAPEFALKDVNGATVNVAGFKGKVVLLNFWATWCVPCKAEMPWFQEFERNYKDRGFAVVGASLDEDGWEVVKPFIDEHKINYRIIVANPEMAQLYGVLDALPTTFVIDREGRIAATHTGLVSKATYAKQIEQLLENNHAALRLTELADGKLTDFRTN